MYPHSAMPPRQRSSDCLPALFLPTLSEAPSETAILFLLLRCRLTWASVPQYFPGVPPTLLAAASENSVQLHLHRHGLYMLVLSKPCPQAFTSRSHPGDLTHTHGLHYNPHLEPSLRRRAIREGQWAARFTFTHFLYSGPSAC